MKMFLLVIRKDYDRGLAMLDISILMINAVELDQ